MTSAQVHKARRYVLDANALITFLENRGDGATRVRRLMEDAYRQNLPLLLSSINWGEVFYVTWKRWGEAKAHESKSKLAQLPIAVIEVDVQRATRAATIKQRHGLSYADCFAAELAMERGAWLVTADPEFSKVGRAVSIYPLPRHENL